MGVPAESGEGKAQVKVTFPGLTTLTVAPSTTEIVIKKAPAEEAPAPVPAK